MTHRTLLIRALALAGALLLTSACLPQGNGGGGGVIIDEDAGGSDASTSPDLGGCVPDCAGRTCGVDPVCGASCGACDGACSSAGTCDQSSGEGAPQIVSLTTNINTMGPDDTLVISAVITDPDGAADLLGGQLFDANGQSSYGSFAGTGGSYTFDLTWQQLRTLEEIEAPAGATSRALRATFFDQQGSSSSRDLNIRLECDAPDDAICSGSCADLQTDSNNCGSCGNSEGSDEFDCVDGSFTCPGGGELCGGECVDLDLFSDDPENCGTCGNACSDNVSGGSNDVVDQGCFDANCFYLVLELATADSCDSICGAQGLRCDDSIEGFPCGDAELGNVAKGCVAYTDPDSACGFVSVLDCGTVPAPPSAAEIQQECGGAATVSLNELVCDCTN